MKSKLDSIAFHEAGHAVAYILAGIPFKHVTIKEDRKKDEHGQRSLGYVENDNSFTSEEWDKSVCKCNIRSVFREEILIHSQPVPVGKREVPGSTAG